MQETEFQLNQKPSEERPSRPEIKALVLWPASEYKESRRTSSECLMCDTNNYEQNFTLKNPRLYTPGEEVLLLTLDPTPRMRSQIRTRAKILSYEVHSSPRTGMIGIGKLRVISTEPDLWSSLQSS